MRIQIHHTLTFFAPHMRLDMIRQLALTMRLRDRTGKLLRSRSDQLQRPSRRHRLAPALCIPIDITRFFTQDPIRTGPDILRSRAANATCR